MNRFCILISGFFLFAFLAFFATPARANLGFNGGEYTNLCGTGTTATSDSCNKGCDTGNGTCSGTAVARFVCDGRQTDCRNLATESWGGSQSLGNPGLDKTVQLDVYNEKCRQDGNWKDNCQPIDYIVWYSGPPSPPPPSAPSCPYGSTQARWQQNISDPWGPSKTINLGQSANAGSFHDATGQFANDTTLTVTGPNTNTTVGNGGTFTPSADGSFTLKVTTNNQPGAACEDTAILTVGTAACTSNGSCSASAPACGTITTGVDNCGNSCTKQGAACPIPPAGGTTNNNTQNTTQNQTVNVTQSQSQTQTPAVVTTAAVPQVAGVTVTTLPKTGLPLLAWSALAFIPAGFRMRAFRKIRKDLEDDPNYIWEDRKFKAGA